MSSFYSYSQLSDVFDEEDKKYIQINGISYPLDFSIHKASYKKYVIKPEEQYRPDKLAFNLWGNQKLDWILDEINFFSHGIKEYTAGTEINYLEKEYLRLIGVL